MTVLPPKPASRAGRVSLVRYARLFRKDILSAQPEHLYRAWMADFRTPWFRSCLANDPALVTLLLRERPGDFPKSERVSEGLRPLLGNSVFVTNGDVWKRQRRIIDPAFEGGRLRDSFPAIRAASRALAARLSAQSDRVVDIEEKAIHAAADVIFRTLFSVPVDSRLASETYRAFRTYQRSQPVLNLAAFVPLPQWMPRFFRRGTRKSARQIRRLIGDMTRARAAEITAGTAPDDLATRIMTQADPQTGDTFDAAEMTDQVAIFFLAGHETSAAALSWALWLLARYPDWQDRVAAEAQAADLSQFSALSGLSVTRDVFRETLRLYPPVPMMVRQTQGVEHMRGRDLPRGTQMILSPWHLHRHTRLWDNPDGFDPGRWRTKNGQECARRAFIPFSAGPRVCPGAGFAMLEGVLMLATVLRDLKVELCEDAAPVPVAHLTVRSRDGIRLRVVRR
ncbi:cytochrome P450 [uncultured Roseobacter sp.]|uniref:cytochrome P450 n=1 Tax=uncultured Roseobacter sp. TaxID=114847 RepID=UPI00261DA4E2|nr:cytochrome P450 [uncultured Roseobacter sp.]